MAGVRNHNDSKFIEPRGIPYDLSYSANEDYWYWISDEPQNGEFIATKSDAERWVANGSSTYKDDRQNRVSDPDAHSCSWLSLEELKEALGRVEHALDVRYKAILSAMEALEDDGKNATRLVFWFDN